MFVLLVGGHELGIELGVLEAQQVLYYHPFVHSPL